MVVRKKDVAPARARARAPAGPVPPEVEAAQLGVHAGIEGGLDMA